MFLALVLIVAFLPCVVFASVCLVVLRFLFLCMLHVTLVILLPVLVSHSRVSASWCQVQVQFLFLPRQPDQCQLCSHLKPVPSLPIHHTSNHLHTFYLLNCNDIMKELPTPTHEIAFKSIVQLLLVPLKRQWLCGNVDTLKRKLGVYNYN